MPKGGCGSNSSASFRYDYCVLRYSDMPFMGLLQENMVVTISYRTNTSDNPDFENRVRNLMEKLLPEAAAAETRFATSVANKSGFETDIYGMAWCTMDLLNDDCLQCLKRAVPKLQTDRNRSTVAKVSCVVRFSTFPFLQLPLQAAQDPDSPGSDFVGNKTDLGGKDELEDETNGHAEDEMMQGIQTLLIDLDVIRTATENFSKGKKLGEGGFGEVYKGTLEDGREIAVKRLSRTSRQGLKQLSNEVAFMAKLQHRNLVKLLGCCLQDEEKLLVYEYLPNTSLDKYLTDPLRRTQLDWGTRYKIIEGIGRGLLYLHQDSVVRVVHRDLKASNILLDVHMNPKILDFGIAKLFNNDETRGLTSDVAGTFGYMSPEYALHGNYSPKSDVYSYGVLVLEIIAGRSNGSNTGTALDLLSHDDVTIDIQGKQRWRNSQKHRRDYETASKRQLKKNIYPCNLDKDTQFQLVGSKSVALNAQDE
ncbi:hypothetical protein HPP92_012332 [Vanilla planifolia]|uniref:non-specific serine/threonine protein kinase n=1 Tax=Vanilla planifolia TaxID=51239 RepID=A0A835QZA2_VANPL|nr:hypothetical protein HPP92_012332 [Vanilla planifolia]